MVARMPAAVLLVALALFAPMATEGARALRTSPESADGLLCTTCLTYVQMAEDYVVTNSTMKMISSLIRAEVCPNVPTPAAKKQCFADADTLVAEFMTYVEAEVTPRAVCTYFDMCNATVAKELAAPADECATCKMIMMEAQAVLANNATTTAILKYLAMACTKVPIPAAEQAQCEAMVTAFGPTMIAQIEAIVSPALCTKVGVCPAKKAATPILIQGKAAHEDHQVAQQ